MGHARTKDLRDLDEVLASIRALPGVVERSRGVFYLRRAPFLHFHVRGETRYADAKIGQAWGPEIPLPFEAGRTLKAAFMKEVRARHKACLNAGAS
jgi:hypothetical protein